MVKQLIASKQDTSTKSPFGNHEKLNFSKLENSTNYDNTRAFILSPFYFLCSHELNIHDK